ncbi:hypothetical protein [Actinomyces mediterranea]|nr:hypothetical protein [Actinomyces mediterranea]
MPRPPDENGIEDSTPLVAAMRIGLARPALTTKRGRRGLPGGRALIVQR